jgi:hypothetical protein
MTPKDDQPDFDWVIERSKCSVAIEFSELKKLAKANAQARDKQLGSNTGIEHSEPSSSSFSIRRHEGGKNEQIVTFSLEESRILISDPRGAKDYELTVTLNDEGECRFQIGGSGEFKRWQVLNRTLGRIFFQS